MTRAERVAAAALDAFWAAVAAGYPEARTGDVDPVTVAELGRAASRAVATWEEYNLGLDLFGSGPATMEGRNLDD